MNMVNAPLGGFKRTPFVGREDERAAIRRLIDQAVKGRGGIVLISGEPGVGKSRLAEEMALEAGERGYNTFTGHFYETEGAPPYTPFVEIFELVSRALPPPTLRSVLGDAAPEVAKLAPDIRILMPDIPPPLQLAPEQDRHFLFNRIREVVERLARERPLLFVLEDLHWGDSSTLPLLQHLASGIHEVPLLILGTYRDAEVDLGRPFAKTLEDLIRRRLVERLALKRLVRADVEAMLRQVGAQDPPASLTDAIYSETDGNPFFVEEVFQHLAEEGKLFDSSGRWKTDLKMSESDVPESIRLVIGRRLERLHPATREVLATASVIGRAFEPAILEAVSGLGYDALLDAIEEAERARLIMPATAETETIFTFAHELVRQTLLLSLSMPRRQRLHLEIADAIEQLHADDLQLRVSNVAHHLHEAGLAADPERTVYYLDLAGKQAMSAVAFDEAAGYYERALQVLAPKQRGGRQHCELLLELAAALWSAGDLPQAGEHFKEAAELAKKLQIEELVAQAVLGMSEGWGWMPAERMVGLLTEALEALPERDDPLRARMMARLALELQGIRGDTRDQRERLSEHAVEIARRTGDPETLGYTLGCWGSVFRGFADADERLAVANEALGLPGSPVSVAGARQDRILALLQLGEIRQADEEHATLRRLAGERREPFSIWEALRYDTMRALLEGRFEDAELIAQEQLQFARRMGRFPGSAELFSAQMLVIRWNQGRLVELEVPVRDGLDRFPQDQPAWSATLALICAEQANEEGARSEFEKLAVGGFLEVSGHRNRVLSVALLVDVCAYLRDAKRAEVLYAMLLPLRDRHLTARNNAYLGPADRYLGVLAATMGLFDDAARHFEKSLEMSAAIGARPALAQTQYDFAKTLLARRGPGDRVNGRDLLRLALDSSEALGMAGLAAKARRLAGGPIAPPSPAGLSPREVEVLRLLAEGRSSREVGRELVLTVRTVERHITNIYRKIGAHNRAQATSFALEHGLAGRT